MVANMSKNNFDFKYVIGRGGFGKVSLLLYTQFASIFLNLGMESRVSQDQADLCYERDV